VKTARNWQNPAEGASNNENVLLKEKKSNQSTIKQLDCS
jgi:hypothetical protein